MRSSRTSIATVTADLDPWATALPVNLAGMGFPPPYPKATAFAPGDSPMSSAFATTDGIDTVLSHFKSALGKEPIEFGAFEASLSARSTKSFEEHGKQMQTLQAEYLKTQDPKLLEKMQELSKAVTKGMESSLSKCPFPGAPTNASAKVFVAEQDGDTPIRAVVVYPEPLLGRTVVSCAYCSSTNLVDVQSQCPMCGSKDVG